MAVYEQIVLLSGIDADGNRYLLYPITTLDCVDGAEDLLHFDTVQELTEEQQARVRSNLGIPEAGQNIFSAKAILPVAGWEENAEGRYVQTISLPGVLAVDEPFVDMYLLGLTDEQQNEVAAAWASAVNIVTGDGTLTACFCDLPEVDIPIKIKEVR